MNKLLKIGIPIIIVLLMLIVVGSGTLLARERDTSALTRTTASYAGYGQGGCCGGSPGNYQGTYPPCHSY